MEEFKETIRDLRKDFSEFMKEYYAEIGEIWKKLVELETKVKFFIFIYVTGITVITNIITGFIIFKLTN